MPNPFSCIDQRILVTGASSGIGRACAQLLSQLGAKLVISGRDEERLGLTMRSLEGSGHIASIFDLNQDFDKIDGWLKNLSVGGAFSGLVHAAGELFTMPVRGTDQNAFERIMSINTNTAFALARAFRQRGVYSKPSSIVFISSIAGVVGTAGLAAYSTSKAALIGMSRSIAIEFARDAIRVNSVSPGYIRSEMTKIQREKLTSEQIAMIEASHPLGLGNVEDVASAVLFLLSPAGKWVTGTNMIIDGGASSF